MRSQETTHQARSFRLQHLVCVALLVSILGQLPISTVHATEDAADPYDTLYDVLMTRWKDGKAYAQNETSPAIFAWSEFPFDDKTFKKFDAAMDAFAALPQEKVEAYSDVKWALLQRHLWKVFDTTFNWDWWKGDWYWGGRKYFPKTHMDRRKASQPKLVALIRRLALTKKQILALPNPLATTVKSGGFATAHDPKDRFKPFLPADLYGKDSSFICLGEDRHEIPASTHTGKLYSRSMFLQFMRLPGGRTETLEYMERIKKKTELFPVGTQFALIEQPYLISKQGEMILSPMIVSVQLRAYLDVGRTAREARPEATQCVTEFVMPPRQLMKGNAVMRALTPKDFRYEAGEEFAAGFSPKDPFATGDITEGLPGTTRLNSCMGCHGRKPGVRTRSFRTTKFFFKEIAPDEISKATRAQKHGYKDWKRLRELWQADVKNEGSRIRENSVEDARPVGILTNPATQTADPYDVLYDVIMTRYGPDGKAYGSHESSPSIFRHSTFPFGDKTYKKLDAALDAFAALPQKEIKAYSDIKRALMQRHLWHVFDAAVPIRWAEYGTDKVHEYRGTYPDRRDAVRSKIASLIQRLALTKAQILALPDTRTATLKSGVFSPRHNPKEPFKPFLPAELHTVLSGIRAPAGRPPNSKESSWVSIGFDDGPPAPRHSKKLKFRSAFLTFMRVPGGRNETLKYIKNGTQDRNNLQHFPAGTQFAFMEQAVLISDEGEMVLSPLIVSISLRAYLDVQRSFWKTRPPTQSLAEFVMQPRQLMQGNAVMKALGQTDLRLEAGDVDGFGVASEPFEKIDEHLRSRPRKSMLRIPRLTLCMRCHSERGVESVGGGAGLFGVKEKSPEQIVNATLTYKRKHYTWKMLSKLWQADSAGEEPSRPDQAQHRSGNTEATATSKHPQPELRRSAPRSGLQISQRPKVLATSITADEKVASDPYDVLYDVIMMRYGPDGKTYGANESSPSIFKESKFPFDDKTYSKFNAALNAFAALPQKKIEAYSDIQRALMQRHLWQVFDATLPFRWVGTQNVWSRSHPDRRDAVRPKIASLIQRLALTKAQILALPDTRAATVKSGGFAQQHDLKTPLKPFLSADLYSVLSGIRAPAGRPPNSKESSWVSIGFATDPPAPFHQNKLKFRSAFLTFMRLPGGRTETLKYVKEGSRQKGDLKQFPVGTQFALIEQAFLISDKGEMILSPLIVSISLRAYLDVERNAPKLGRDPTQALAEFVMQPRRLIQGDAVMKALGPRDVRFEAGDVDIHNDAVEPFEDTVHVPLRADKDDMLRRPRLTLCMNCHKSRGRRGVRGGYVSDVKEIAPEDIVKTTLKYKRDHETWKALSKLWRSDSAGEGSERAADENIPVTELTKSSNSGSQRPKVLATSATTDKEVAADPYNVLYDVIMTRYAKDGKSYAKNENSPAIFPQSNFPFGDKTYEKFNAALDSFAALPQAKIEAYSDVQRALLQRHLWKVFDATHPGRMQQLAAHFPGRGYPAVRSHSDRRAAVQPKIASLIQRLALTKAQIHTLPDTMATTIETGGFAQTHDPTDLFKPFLPADLGSKKSSWVCLGEADTDIPTEIHTEKFHYRTAFFSFMRVPAGNTRESIEAFNRTKAFPEGTQFALIEQAFLISDGGEMILSPLVVSISLRAYVGVKKHRNGRLRVTQSVAEFVMQPRQLMRGNAVMKPLGQDEYRFEAGNVECLKGGVDDPFETGGLGGYLRLNNCRRCHANFPSYEAKQAGLNTTYPPRLKEGSSEAISKATATQKREDVTWKSLRELWQADVKNESSRIRENSAEDARPVGILTNPTTKTADPYDELYDVIMVRKDFGGKAFGHNEVAPFLYVRSEFPFDGETFPKLTAALERFNALPQEKIAGYGAVKRPLLQRHLWAVFDVTMPPPDYKPRTHMANRRAAQKTLATLIRRLALTKAEILTLPDTRAATIKSGGFPQQHDPTDSFKPFLPVDLYAKDSSWVCLGKVDRDETHHARVARWRSAFFPFVRLPAGRKATSEYIEKLNAREVFPVGTQFALIDQAFLISDRGELVLSPLINSIQLRAYLNVTMTDLEAPPRRLNALPNSSCSRGSSCGASPR